MLKAFVTLAKKGRTPSIENTWGKRYISASPIMEGRCFKEIWIFIQFSLCPTIFVRYDRSVLVFDVDVNAGVGNISIRLHLAKKLAAQCPVTCRAPASDGQTGQLLHGAVAYSRM